MFFTAFHLFMLSTIMIFFLVCDQSVSQQQVCNHRGVVDRKGHCICFNGFYGSHCLEEPPSMDVHMYKSGDEKLELRTGFWDTELDTYYWNGTGHQFDYSMVRIVKESIWYLPFFPFQRERMKIRRLEVFCSQVAEYVAIGEDGLLIVPEEYTIVNNFPNFDEQFRNVHCSERDAFGLTLDGRVVGTRNFNYSIPENVTRFSTLDWAGWVYYSYQTMEDKLFVYSETELRRVFEGVSISRLYSADDPMILASKGDGLSSSHSVEVCYIRFEPRCKILDIKPLLLADPFVISVDGEIYYNLREQEFSMPVRLPFEVRNISFIFRQYMKANEEWYSCCSKEHGLKKIRFSPPNLIAYQKNLFVLPYTEPERTPSLEKNSTVFCSKGTYGVFPNCKTCLKKENCLGGIDCKEGFLGESHFPCYFCKPRHFQIGRSCRACPKVPHFSVVLLLSIISIVSIVVSYLLVYVKGFLAKISIFISLFQFTYISFADIPFQININLKDWIQRIFIWIPLTSIELVAPSCIISGFHYGFLFKWGIIIYGPMFVFAIGALILGGIFIFKQYNLRSKAPSEVWDERLFVWNEMIKRFLVFFLLGVYTFVIKTLIRSFDPKSYGKHGSSVKWLQVTIILVVTIPSLLVYAMVPFVILIILLILKLQKRRVETVKKMTESIRENIKNTNGEVDAQLSVDYLQFSKKLKKVTLIFENLQVFQKFQEPYKEMFWFFAIVELCRKVWLSILAALPVPNPWYALFQGVRLVSSILFFGLLILLRPYATDYSNIGKFTFKNTVNLMAISEAFCAILTSIISILLASSFLPSLLNSICIVIVGMIVALLILGQLLIQLLSLTAFLVRFIKNKSKKNEQYSRLKSKESKLYFQLSKLKFKMIQAAQDGNYDLALGKKRELDALRSSHLGRLHNKKSFYFATTSPKYEVIVKLLDILETPKPVNLNEVRDRYEKLKDEFMPEIIHLEDEIESFDVSTLFSSKSTLLKLRNCKQNLHEAISGLEKEIIDSEIMITKKGLSLCQTLKRAKKALNFEFYDSKNRSGSEWDRIERNFLKREETLKLIEEPRGFHTNLSKIEEAYSEIKTFTTNSHFENVAKMHFHHLLVSDSYDLEKAIRIYEEIRQAGSQQQSLSITIEQKSKSEILALHKQCRIKWLALQESRLFDHAKEHYRNTLDDMHRRAIETHQEEIKFLKNQQYKLAHKMFVQYSAWMECAKNWQ